MIGWGFAPQNGQSDAQSRNRMNRGITAAHDADVKSFSPAGHGVSARRRRRSIGRYSDERVGSRAAEVVPEMIREPATLVPGTPLATRPAASAGPTPRDAQTANGAQLLPAPDEHPSSPESLDRDRPPRRRQGQDVSADHGRKTAGVVAWAAAVIHRMTPPLRGRPRPTRKHHPPSLNDIVEPSRMERAMYRL